MSANDVIAQLLVIRHGQSEWNVQERWQGHADIELTEAGINQARLAAERLGTFDYIASSQLQRALHTAQIIAETHGVGPVVVDERLLESDVGPWQGLTRHQIEAQWPGYLNERRKPDGFESDESIVARSTAAFCDIAASCAASASESMPTALIVSHSGVIRTLRHTLGVHNPKLHNLGGCWFFVHRNNRITAGDIVSVIGDVTGDTAPTDSL